MNIQYTKFKQFSNEKDEVQFKSLRAGLNCILIKWSVAYEPNS